MANGYLGKISAIVSANTADFDSKLSKSAAEVKKFAGSMDGTLRSAQSGAGTSLRGIYTDAQKLQRALTAVSTQKLDFSGFKGLNLAEAVTQLQAVYSVSQQIGRPLAGAAKTMSGLSAGVQAEFLPAMIRAQTATETLSEVIDRTGSAGVRHFQSVEKQVDRTVAAMRRMSETNTMVSGIATGQELRFQRPELSAEMQRTAALQSQAAQMSPAAMSRNGVSGLVAQQRAAALETERLAAALERESLLINGNVAAATVAYQSQLDVQRKINDELDRRIELEASIGARTDISNVGRSSPFVNPLIGQRTDISDVGRSSLLADRRRDLARTAMGDDIDAPRRQLGVLESSITSLKSKIEALPEPIRTRFVPAIRDAESEFIRLSTAAAPVAGDIEAARSRMARLTQDATRAAQAMNFRESFGGGGPAGVSLGLDQKSLQGYNAQLQILQAAIGRASAEARGPAVTAFNRLRSAVATAFDEGNIDSAESRERLAALRAEAIAAAAAVSRIRVGTLTRDIGRAGDIGRQGFDKFSLAVNQGAYVIDDFMSSTGGIEQKLRAIGNNVTQLGFVLGGTTGLLVSLGAVLVGQAAVAIVRWMNNGQTAEDKTKSLNEALERQKNLVQELAEAFKSLGESMAQDTFSSAGKAIRDFAKQREDIEKKQKEIRESRVSDLDMGVQRERAQQNTIRGQLEKETDLGRRVVLQEQLNESIRREKRRARAVNDVSDPGGDVTESAIERAAYRQKNALGFGDNTRTVEALLNSTRGMDSGSSIEAMRSQMAAIASAISALQGPSAETFLGFQTPAAIAANASIAELAKLSARLSKAIDSVVDDIALSVFDLSRGPAEDIRRAQEEVVEAIKAGIPGARLFALELDKNANALEAAYKKLDAAASEEDSAKKQVLIDEAKTKIDELRTQRADIERQADALRYERVVDPQRQIEARTERVGENLNVAGLPDGQLARRMREIEDRRETLRQQASKTENQNPMAQRLIEQSEAALNAEVAAIEAATLALKKFAEALDRASSEAAGNLTSAQQAADEARRADLRNSTPESRADRKRAEEDLDRQRQTERKAQQDIENQRAKQEEDVQRGEELVNDQREIAPKAQAAMEAQDAVNTAIRAAIDAGIPETGSFSGNAKAAREAGREDIALLQEKAEKAVADAAAVLGVPWENFWDAVDAALLRAEFLAGLAENTFSDEYARLREIQEQLASGALSADEQEQLRAERASLQAKVEPDIEKSRKQAEKAVEASTQEEEVRKSAERGRELRRTPEESFATETEQGLRDIREAFGRDAENNDGIVDIIGLNAAEDRFKEDREREARTATSAGRGREAFLNDRERFARDTREGIARDMTAGAIDQAGLMNIAGRRALLEKGITNQMQNVAPMLQGFEEERQNAQIQGPSRTALQMSDVSTSQGASELTRLLRGDDSAKDVNLAELRKQTAKFEELIQAVRDQNPGILL